MNLRNDYVIMYSAFDRVSEEKPGPVYASKGIPSATDAMLISTNNGGDYVDIREFKLIYSDGKHIFGSISGIPAEDDINIVLLDGIGGVAVLGETR